MSKAADSTLSKLMSPIRKLAVVMGYPKTNFLLKITDYESDENICICICLKIQQLVNMNSSVNYKLIYRLRWIEREWTFVWSEHKIQYILRIKIVCSVNVAFCVYWVLVQKCMIVNCRRTLGWNRFCLKVSMEIINVGATNQAW